MFKFASLPQLRLVPVLLHGLRRCYQYWQLAIVAVAAAVIAAAENSYPRSRHARSNQTVEDVPESASPLVLLVGLSLKTVPP